MRDLSDALIAVFGTDFGVHSPTWISRFTDTTRQAATYRDRRVLLAGDAAHIHYPAGGQGLSLGVQDAVNLGWKLAQVVHGTSPDGLLDTYHEERHPVGARALEHTIVQAALQRRDDRMAPPVDLVSAFGEMDEPRKKVVGTISALDIHYDLGDADIGGWNDRVQLVAARYGGAWELPVVGTVRAPSGVLIRPDGYVAWVGEGTADGLTDALAMWFGAPVGAAAST